MEGNQRFQTQQSMMLRQSSLNSNLNQENEVIQIYQKETLRIIKNQFVLLTILHLIIMALFVFCISFYQWYKVTVKYDNNVVKVVWFNLLYIYDNKYITFENYKNTDLYYCQSARFDNDSTGRQICQNSFDNLEMIGYISFTMIFIGIIFQIVDIVKTYFLTKLNRERWCIKSKCLQPFIVFLHGGALFLYFLNVYFLKDIGLWSSGKFGAAYWSGICSVPTYVVLIIYYRYTKSKLIDREMIGSLMTSADLQDKKINLTRISLQQFNTEASQSGK